MYVLCNAHACLSVCMSVMFLVSIVNTTERIAELVKLQPRMHAVPLLLGKEAVLETLYGAFQRCSRVRLYMESYILALYRRPWAITPPEVNGFG